MNQSERHPRDMSNVIDHPFITYTMHPSSIYHPLKPSLTADVHQMTAMLITPVSPSQENKL
jgi:hypothetical protein